MKPNAARVLILCTANSARSQMAEGLLRHLGGDAFEAHSAGTRPATVRPEAIAVMREAGVEIAHHRSKPAEAFLGERMDWVITVCDRAREDCPVFPGAARRVHWGFDDPAAAAGGEEARLESFRRVRDEIAARLRLFVREAPALARLADGLRRSCEGDAWHGPSLREVLAGVGAEAAAARPVAGAHTIWEIALHAEAWMGEVARRLRGGTPALPEPGDWPPTAGPGDAAWRAARARLEETGRRLLAEVDGFDPTRLGEPVGHGENREAGFAGSHHLMLRGVIEHNLYHAGQIALLRRAAH